MDNQTSCINKAFLTLIALISWFALVFQFYLAIINRKLSLPGAIVYFFSFFTILTNLIVAVCCTAILIKPTSRRGKFFSQPTTLTAVTLYIVVVGLVYNFILRFLWSPTGLQKIVDELLHAAVPALFLLYWAIFVHKESLQWKNVFPWLLFPFIYSLYVLLRGAITSLYPYPFMDVVELGYKRVLINCGFLVIVFLLAALLFVATGKIAGRFKNKPSGF